MMEKVEKLKKMSGIVMFLSIDWKLGAITIIMIKSTRKISVKGVMFISLNTGFLPSALSFIAIFTSNYRAIEPDSSTFTSSSESIKLKNTNLINLKSLSNLETTD